MSKFTKALNKIQSLREGRHEKDEQIRQPSIPSYDLKEPVRLKSDDWDQDIPSFERTQVDQRIVNYHYPSSVISEQYRSLRTNLKAKLSKDGAQVFIVSSSINGEGKTVTSLNLAYSFAEAHACKVAIVDGDLRRGKVATYMGLDKNLKGVTEYLQSDELEFKDIVVKNSLHNLYFIPRGHVAHDAAKLVNSERFAMLVANLRKHFDYVIIDAPPIMSVADAAILGKQTDGMVMVVQSGRTPKTVIAHAHELFKQGGIKLLGYVLTNVEFQSSNYRYYSYKYYGEHEADESLKGKASVFFRRMGMNFERNEEKFSNWMKNKKNKDNNKKIKA